jgi:NDP-sugar pyrophosphorylase family protein
MKAVVLAGGRGTRLAPYTHILPKPLVPIGDMPILEVILRQMKRAGIHDVVLTVGHLAGLMRSYFGEGEKLDLRISYQEEDQPLGTAGPLASVPGLGQTFLVTNGDVLTNLQLRELVSFHERAGGAATIAVHKRQVRVDLGVVESDADGFVTGYIEKPTFDYTVSMGIYVFEPRVLEFIPRGEYMDFPDLVLKIIAAGGRINGYLFDGYWRDLGRRDDYERATLDFESMRAEFLPEQKLAAGDLKDGATETRI